MSQTSKDASLFNPDDFQSIDLRVYLQNLATNDIVRDDGKISILEFGDRTLTLSLPRSMCESGQHFIMNVYRPVKSGSENLALFFSSTVKVEVLTEHEEGMASAKLRLLQFDKKGWDNLLELFNSRQEEIMKFLEMGKR